MLPFDAEVPEGKPRLAVAVPELRRRDRVRPRRSRQLACLIFSQCRSHFKKDRGNLFPVQSTRRVEWRAILLAPANQTCLAGIGTCCPLSCVVSAAAARAQHGHRCRVQQRDTGPVVLGSELGVRL